MGGVCQVSLLAGLPLLPKLAERFLGGKSRHHFVDASADVSRLCRIGVTLRIGVP